ncbi:hypothetical protein [Microvirga terricola]|uniref:Secreted protein n=1 Tax=Microvirga terricola TaxID=2719797 RepID=A0ABX0VC55_9HYPH|nr:hypothetical protein [Microvirga terricola]NIX76656.1 hypothetical protein [Microvirga terricola]
MTKIRPMHLFLTTALLACAFAGAASAEETPPSSKAMVLTVRPSGYDKQNDAQARQEKLLKRMEQSDYMVRSICSQCGDNWKHQTYAPFNPLASLSARNKTAEENAR